MRRCGICKLAPRCNDPMGSVQVPVNSEGVQPGHYMACSECCNHWQPGGQFAAYVQTFCVGNIPDPTAPGTESLVRELQSPDGTLPHAPAGFCAVCKLYAREDDSMEAMRLYPEDAPDRPDLFQRGREECYMCCGECRKKYAPAILRRLIAQGVLKEGFPVEAMGPLMFA